MPSVSSSSVELYKNLDLTGASSDNLVEDEIHQIASYSKTIVKPRYGKFYKDDLALYYYTSGGELIEMTYGTAYVCAEYDRLLSRQSGREVYGAINILVTTIPGIISLNYRAVGGANNVNTAEVYSQSEAVLTDITAIAFDDIADKDDTFTPDSHQHDAADVYGFDYIVANINDLANVVSASKTVFGSAVVPVKDVDTWLKVKSLKSTLSSAISALNTAIAAHIGNTAYAHTYTAEMIGIGNVVNLSFTTTLNSNGDVIPVYASPATIAAALATLPTAGDFTAHKSSTANPHGDTAASVGFGNVSNLGMIETYTTGTSAFNSVLYNATTEAYMAPYPMIYSIMEAYADFLATKLVTPLNTLVNGTGTSIATVSALVATVTTQVNTIESSVSTTSDNIENTLSVVAEAVNANSRWDLVDYNRPYAEGLKLLLAYEYAHANDGWGTSATGYWSLPPYVENLYLWLDSEYSGNTYKTDSDGATRLTALQDRSSYQRLFVSPGLSTSPKYQVSEDVTDGVNGMTNGKVAYFEPGNYFEQISGKAVSLNPGMTIFVMARPGSSKSILTLLTDTKASPRARVFLQGDDNRAISAVTTTTWTPLLTPKNSSVPDTSGIFVASIGESSEDINWFASSNPIDATNYPRGIVASSSSWPSADYVSTAMTRIGSTDSDGSNTGELAQLIIYNRQLSFAEVEAVVDYLRLLKSNNQSFAVDYSAKNAF